MARTIIAGIGVSDNIACLSVIEHRDNKKELLYLDQLEQTNESPYWYLDLLDNLIEPMKIDRVAIALDPSSVAIIRCPMEIGLSQSDRNQQINWELSHYVEDYHPQHYINDVHVLETDHEENIERLLVVSAPRNLIFGLQEALTERRLHLGIVDVNHFAADTALIQSHPDSERILCCSLGIGSSRLDASILRGGQMTAYRYALPSTSEEFRSFISTLMEDYPITSLYVHGSHLTREREKLIKSTVNIPVTILNPFRRMMVSLNFTGFTRYANLAHRFAPAVGIALRTS